VEGVDVDVPVSQLAILLNTEEGAVGSSLLSLLSRLVLRFVFVGVFGENMIAVLYLYCMFVCVFGYVNGWCWND